MTDFVYQTYDTGDTTVTLNHGLIDTNGNFIANPTPIATYKNFGTDQNTGAIFDNTYSSFELGQNDHAVFYTVPTKGTGYAPSDLTTLKMQAFDDNGDQIQGATTLDLGGKTGIKDLYSISESSGADFGNSFVVAYSTFDPSTGKAAIAYEQFDDSGNAIQSGTLASFNDDSHHGITFSSFYGSTNPNANGSPDFLLEHRTVGGQQLEVQLFDPNMSLLGSTTISETGPQGQAASALDKFGFLKPGSGTTDNTALLSQTFEYVDSSGKTHEEIAIEKVNPTTLAVQAKTEFADVAGTHSGVGMAHLTNGDYVVAYVDGTHTDLKEFNAKLKQIGQTYVLPNDNNGFDNLVNLKDGTFEIFWRQLVSPSTSSETVQHSAILTTSGASHDIVAASSVLTSHKNGLA